MSDTPKRKRGRERERPGPYRWAVQVFFLAIVLSAALSLASETSLSGAGAAAAALVLAVFIGLGILFDIIGVAVTAADPRPFHSMAAHKEPGAKEALVLLRNAGRVSSVCNDVVGDHHRRDRGAAPDGLCPAGERAAERGGDGPGVRPHHRRQGPGQDSGPEQKHQRGLLGGKVSAPVPPLRGGWVI